MTGLLERVRSHWDEFQNYGSKSFDEVLAMGKRLLELRDMVKQGLAFGPNTWKAWVAEKQQRPADADDHLPFGLRQANRYISVYNLHEKGKIAFDPDCFTFAGASNDSNQSKTQPFVIDFTDEEGVWHGNVRCTKKGRFILSWQEDESMLERMDDDNVCCRVAIDVAKLAFRIVARTKVQDGVMQPMLDTLTKLSMANGDAPKLAAAMKKAVGA